MADGKTDARMAQERAAIKSRRPRIVVFETSALVGLLNHFTDPHKPNGNALEALLRSENGQRALIDEIAIPDHVFYELTGILPISFPKMLQQFAATADDPAARQAVIDFYVTSSPRGGARVENGAFIKDQVRDLLAFVAAHPHCLQATDLSASYCQRLKVTHAALGGIGAADLPQYKPTFADAFDTLGQRFNPGTLRVHAGQLYMMGFFSEDDYNQRIGPKKHAKDGSEAQESPYARKQRFILIKDFAEMLYKKGGKGKSGWIDEESYQMLKEAADSAAQEGGRQPYLTVDFLTQFPGLLTSYRHNGTRQKPHQSAECKSGDVALVMQALKPSRLLMEHYIFSEIIPKDAMLDVAALLRYDLSQVKPGDNLQRIQDKLYRQGFFERSLTADELGQIAQHLAKPAAQRQQLLPEALSYRAMEYNPQQLVMLNDFVQALPQAAKARARDFDMACRSVNGKRERSNEAVNLAEMGCPYETMLAQELINGTVSPSQFMQILLKSQSLIRQPEGRFATGHGDIIVEPARSDGDDTIIWVSQEGFISRNGKNTITRHYSGAGQKLLSHNGASQQERYYWRFTMPELIDICRNNRGYAGPKDKLDRVFEGLLYRAVTVSASRMHGLIEEIMGEETLLQMEKDFSNRHMRRWREVMPPFADPFAALHVNRRLMRKNMGEIATAEIAVRLGEAQPQSDIWLINHDSDLYPDKDGTLQFSETLQRMHSEKNNVAQQSRDQANANQHWLQHLQHRMQEQSQGEGRLHFVRTDQFLDTLSELLHHPHQSGYEGLTMKEHIRDYFNSSWQSRVHGDAQRMGNSR